ncbi:MAG TPA: spermidine synthase [Castellaniella sp.]|uniref:spermidine synthase n=1 Tax=Castellaniella sp. TaxID=1955812 RepID=UPI002F198BA4
MSRRTLANRPAWQVAAELDEPTLSEQDGVRYLHFNSEWVQGAMRVKCPSELVLAYAQQMFSWMLFVRPSVHEPIGILGLGAGSLLRFVLRHTRSQAETVERNRQVVAVCRSYFRLPGSARSVVTLGDARDWVAQPGRVGRYRALMVDLYDAEGEGPACSGADFYRNCAQSLSDSGAMSVNLFGRHESFAQNLEDIQAAFGGPVFCLPEVDEGNTVVLALKSAVPQVDVRVWLDRARVLESRTGLPARRWVHSLLPQAVFPVLRP